MTTPGNSVPEFQMTYTYIEAMTLALTGHCIAIDVYNNNTKYYRFVRGRWEYWADERGLWLSRENPPTQYEDHNKWRLAYDDEPA